MKIIGSPQSCQLISSVISIDAVYDEKQNLIEDGTLA